jgi:hypothetical protein
MSSGGRGTGSHSTLREGSIKSDGGYKRTSYEELDPIDHRSHPNEVWMKNTHRRSFFGLTVTWKKTASWMKVQLNLTSDKLRVLNDEEKEITALKWANYTSVNSCGEECIDDSSNPKPSFKLEHKHPGQEEYFCVDNEQYRSQLIEKISAVMHYPQQQMPKSDPESKPSGVHVNRSMTLELGTDTDGDRNTMPTKLPASIQGYPESSSVLPADPRTMSSPQSNASVTVDKSDQEPKRETDGLIYENQAGCDDGLTYEDMSLTDAATWKGNVTDAAEFIKAHTEHEGLYLIRPSDGPNKALLVVCDAQPCKFHIKVDPKTKSVTAMEQQFENMEKMLQHFRQNRLRGKTTTLTTSYKKLKPEVKEPHSTQILNAGENENIKLTAPTGFVGQEQHNLQ